MSCPAFRRRVPRSFLKEVEMNRQDPKLSRTRTNDVCWMGTGQATDSAKMIWVGGG